MVKELTLVLSPKQASSEDFLKPVVAKKLKLTAGRITQIQVKGRSIDARGKKVKIQLRVVVYVDSQPPENPKIEFDFKNVSGKNPVIIVGAGPAGLFAALKLICLGLKPIVLERGNDVDNRKRDIANIHRNIEFNTDSNYGFGEGGAGTFSDGKLFTRSKKRGSVKDILDILHLHGANSNILIGTHPHIGSDKLPGIIKSIRETIINCGGEVHFNTKVSELIITNGQISGVVTAGSGKIESKAVVIATGHSARDIYEMLHRHNIALEAKPYAMGVRVEHPQQLIDSIQYSCPKRGPYLPAATYSLVQQVQNRGVYSFCMCPGGVIVPASTAQGQMVVNGMSPSNRNTKWANSGMVVEIRLDDLTKGGGNDVLAGLRFQKEFERQSFINGGNGQIAPAQRVVDFFDNKLSTNLPESSFRPGLISSAMHYWMPEGIRKRLQVGLMQFGKKMKGYFTNEAIIVGVESRTSSPIRIPRDYETMQHIQVKGLFPCGEGAGYTGGIVSSAIDGQNCATKVKEFIG